MDRFVKLITLPSLEEAMMYYATRPGTMAFKENDWKLFKFEYPCAESSIELFNKFWDDIIENMNTNAIVTENSELKLRLSCIPNPKTVIAAAPTPVSMHEFLKY